MLEEYEELKKHILTELESKRMIATGVGMGYYTSDLKLIVTRAANSMKSRQFEEVADGTD